MATLPGLEALVAAPSRVSSAGMRALAAASKLEIVVAPLLFQPPGWTVIPGPRGNGASRHRNGSGAGGSAQWRSPARHRGQVLGPPRLAVARSGRGGSDP